MAKITKGGDFGSMGLILVPVNLIGRYSCLKGHIERIENDKA